MRNVFTFAFLAILFLISQILLGNCAMYQVIFERAMVTKYNKSLGGNLHVMFSKINRTSFAVNASFDLRTDLNVDLMKAKIQAYKFASNEYKVYPISVSVGICAEYKREFFMPWKEVMAYTNIPGCGPMKKGHYYIKNYVPKFGLQNVPMREGRYRLNGKIYQGDIFLAEGDGYGTVKFNMRT